MSILDTIEEEMDNGFEDAVLRGIMSVPIPDDKPPTKNKAFWTAENKLLAWKKFDREATAYEPLFRRVMVKFFRDVNAQVQDKLEKHGVKIKSNIGAMGLNGRQKWLADHKDRLNEFLPMKDTLKKRLKADMKPTYLSVLEQSGKGRVEEFSRYMPKKTKDVDAEIDFEYDVYDPEVVKWLGNRLEEFSETTAQTTINDTKRTLREDFENGEPLMKMSEHLRDYFEGAETYRANLIARTESTASMNEGDMTAVSQMDLGDSVGKVWLAEPDPLTRATHAAAGERYADGTDAETGERMTLDKEFNVGDDKMLHPAGGQIAEENCNCRCGMVYEMLEGGDLEKSFFDKGGPGSGRYPAGSGDRPNQHHGEGYYAASGESAHGEGKPEDFQGGESNLIIHSGLNEEIVAADQAAVMKATNGNTGGIEYVATTLPDGTKVLLKGNQEGVHIPFDVMEKITYLAHNHPRNCSLSAADVTSLVANKNMLQIDAMCDKNGTTIYSLQKPDGWKNPYAPLEGNWKGTYNMVGLNYGAKISELNTKNRYLTRFRNGEDKNQLAREHTHEVMKIMASMYNLKYTRMVNGEEKRFKAVDDRKVTESKDGIFMDDSLSWPDYVKEGKNDK